MSLIVGLMAVAAFAGLSALLQGAAAAPSVSPLQAPGPATISYRYSDFFKQPYGEWWDYRYVTYGDLPINAECFNATSIADLVCAAADPAVPDVETYPFTNWYPLPGNIRPGHQFNNPMIYAPYRLGVAAANISGYDLSDPVFLPVLNSGAVAGTSLAFDWNMQYLDKASATTLQNAGCGRIVGSMDGFIVRSQISLTMDIQESRRIFGVVGNTASEAATWWGDNALPGCLVYGPLEDSLELWYTDMGNNKYDVVNSFEYAYTPFFTSMGATVDADGTTHVTIDHVAWGGEVLVSRWFYWGRAGYQQNYLDSTKRNGWWGMELAWFEDFHFRGNLGESWMDFNLDTIMQYHFQQLALPGPNGIYDKTDDVPYWTWGPILTDYTNDYTPTHLLSELDRYPYPYYSYVHSTPGSPLSFYGQAQPYDYAPIAWNPAPGETWHFEFPTTPVVFYDPNLTPYGADPSAGQYVAVSANLGFSGTFPASFGTFDPATGFWDVVGPLATGGPVGSPGADGIPGTTDDEYALSSWGSISFTAFVPPTEIRNADLLGRSAWPERHHWDMSKDVDGKVALYANVANLGNAPVKVSVIFVVTNETGVSVTIETVDYTLAPGETRVITDYFTPLALGKYSATAQVHYDKNGDGTLDSFGAKVKSFSFTVVP